MFCYCARCANIENIKGDSIDQKSCIVCGHMMQPVPSEYIMTNGTFFKSQKEREKLILAIKSSETYDASIGDIKEGLLKQKAEQHQKQVDEANQRMQEQQFKLKCPVCGSNSVQKISTIGKYAKVYAFGLLGADSLGKTWKCSICGAKF